MDKRSRKKNKSNSYLPLSSTDIAIVSSSSSSSSSIIATPAVYNNTTTTTTTSTSATMTAGSKSSQTTRNIVIACLALWSIISLIIIVVWATSPDMKSANHCRSELQATTEKLEGVKVLCTQDRLALERLVEEGRENQTRQQEEVTLLRARLGFANLSLEECRQENAVLNGNITTLEKEMELRKEVEANLTAEITIRQDVIETLQQNLTQAHHEIKTLLVLNTAAGVLQLAAETRLNGSLSRVQYLDDQLAKCKKGKTANCKIVDHQASEQSAVNAASSPHSSVLALGAVLFTSLRLIT